MTRYAVKIYMVKKSELKNFIPQGEGDIVVEYDSKQVAEYYGDKIWDSNLYYLDKDDQPFLYTVVVDRMEEIESELKELEESVKNLREKLHSLLEIEK